MEKGIDLEVAEQVLRNCDAAGIGFHIFSMIGFPEERQERAWETLGFFLRHRGLISAPRNSFDIHRFTLDLRTEYGEHPEQFGVRVMTDEPPDDFLSLSASRWANDRGMNEATVERLLLEFLAILQRVFRSHHPYPLHLWPDWAPYSMLYADQYADRLFGHRASLPDPGDPVHLRLVWREGVRIEEAEDGYHVRCITGEGVISDSALRSLARPTNPMEVDRLLETLATRVRQQHSAVADPTRRITRGSRLADPDRRAAARGESDGCPGRPRSQSSADGCNSLMTTVAALDRWNFADAGDKLLASGLHRTVPADATFERVRSLLPVMGITRVANITGLDYLGIPVVVVCRPNSRSLAVSQGKGTTLAAARASGVMESIEAYHAERIQHGLKLGSLEELRYSHRVVDVDALPRTSHSHFHPYLPLFWIEGIDLLSDEPVWVPFEMVHTNYTLAARVGAGSFQATSNGLASGNDIREAISHAICEVVERDSTTLWYLLPDEDQESSRIDLDSVDDPACRQVLDCYEAAKILVGVWETTSDVGLASFICMIADGRDNPFRRLYPTAGMGCHPCREVALSRALTEAAQSRLTAIAGSRDDVTRAEYERYRDPEMVRRFRSQLGLSEPRRAFQHVPSVVNSTVSDDVVYELDCLRHAGLERSDRHRSHASRVRDSGRPGCCSRARRCEPVARLRPRPTWARSGSVRALSAYIFTGPTLAGSQISREFDAVFLPPVSQGDVIRVVSRQPGAIRDHRWIF